MCASVMEQVHGLQLRTVEAREMLKPEPQIVTALSYLEANIKYNVWTFKKYFIRAKSQ